MYLRIFSWYGTGWLSLITTVTGWAGCWPRFCWLIDLYYLRCILGSVPDISTELGRVELDDLLVELETIEGNIDNLTTIKHLQLKTMGTIRFQVQVSNQHTIRNRIYFFKTFSHYNSILVTQYFLKLAFGPLAFPQSQNKIFIGWWICYNYYRRIY